MTSSASQYVHACQFCIDISHQRPVSRMHVYILPHVRNANVYSVYMSDREVHVHVNHSLYPHVHSTQAMCSIQVVTSAYIYKVTCNYMSALHVCTRHKRIPVLHQQRVWYMSACALCMSVSTCKCCRPLPNCANQKLSKSQP